MTENSESFRHLCEIQYVLDLPDRAERIKYLDGVEKKRGSEAANKLRSDVYDEYKRRKNGSCAGSR
ncbi:hypothetical protein SAMN05428952_100936 [Nitrosomonas sp. Nm132]|nr:hypothetical protein SAMN05428952_100936 [Nitrosomonas sp. Nm132]